MKTLVSFALLLTLSACNFGFKKPKLVLGEICGLVDTNKRGKSLVLCYEVNGKSYKTSSTIESLYYEYAKIGSPMYVEYESSDPGKAAPNFKQVEWTGIDSNTVRIAEIIEIDSSVLYGLPDFNRIVHYELTFAYYVNSNIYAGATITENLGSIQTGDLFYLFLYENNPNLGVIRLDLPHEDDLIRQLDSLSKIPH